MILQQIQLCKKYKTDHFPAPEHLRLGISMNIMEHIYPINGLRHPPVGNTCGWYVWAGRGEVPTDPDFFKPLHISHLGEYCPQILPYLGLPPGWRFLIAPGYEDVWFDEKLLDI